MISDETAPMRTGLEIATEWAKLPPEHLKAALKALEPQLKREYDFAIARLKAEVDAKEKECRRTHILNVAGLVGGFLVAILSLSGAVILGINNQPWWLCMLLGGPGMFALVKIFVLRQSAPNDLEQLRRAQATLASAAAPTSAPPPVV